MNRLTDNDKRFGPFILARLGKTLSVELSSGDEEEPECYFRIIALGWAFQIALPVWIIPAYKEKKIALGWDEETIKRIGRNWYYNVYRRSYGISLNDMGAGYDFFQLHYGPQTNDSRTTKSWCKHLPWKMWTHVRTSLYNPDGSHFFTDPENKWDNLYNKTKECKSSEFLFKDYDGEEIKAVCIIEEREWHKGEGMFKWLKYFSKRKIARSLDIKFTKEVGPEKGSWKSGTIGHGIDMLPNETPKQAFARYCNKTQERKGKKFTLKLIS